MAGDWIKIESTTPDKPEVHALAAMLGISAGDVLLALIKVWRWFDQHTEDGRVKCNDPSVTEKTLKMLDALSGVENFSEKLREIGWLNCTKSWIEIPNFDRHNGKSSKKRALTNARVAKHRNNNVTLEPLQKALPEKRREEIKEKQAKESKPVRKKYSAEFEEFWKNYPRNARGERGSKADAAKRWEEKLDDEERRIATTDCRVRFAHREPRYIPHAATYLSKKLWEDETSGMPDDDPSMDDLYGGLGRQWVEENINRQLMAEKSEGET